METMSKQYIEELVQSLVNGHASVLVGAGFSKNAEPVNEMTKGKMPDWTQLSDVFCQKLGITEKKQYLNPLTIAQEVEVLYGRPFLDNLIKDQMQNDFYKPSDIHVNLMKLPWADVFTTNYDTLLERACLQVTERRYRVVADQNDLLYSSGEPRIIKLHGSFPSNGPFIITEEDFRTYPFDHAPFVNTVQQSLLENTFYLMGFSGDDPNFLKWIGWIHDNLGMKNSPKIFMITDKQESIAKTKNLGAYNIELILLNDIEAYKDEHIGEAYRKFLEDLVKRVKQRNNTVKKWPGKNHISYKVGKEKEYYHRLKALHDTYPGWIIAPYRIHDLLVSVIGADHFFGQDCEKKRDLELQICYEYCWIQNMIGRPLFKYVLKALKNIVGRYEEQKESQTYQYVVLSMLRAFRIHGLEEEWQHYSELLDQTKLEKEQKNQYTFERIMHQIYTFQYSSLEKMIDSISTDGNQSEWILRKSGLLAMVERYGEAEELLKDGLAYIRHMLTQDPGTGVIRYRSIESCMVVLYNFVSKAKMSASGKITVVLKTEENEGKDVEWVTHKNHYDDRDFVWSNENSHYEDILSNVYINKREESEETTFDLGRFRYTIAFLEDRDALNAYAFLGFREATGIPFRFGKVVYKDGVLGAAKRLSLYNSSIPLVLATFSGDDKIIEGSYGRRYIADMPYKEVDVLCEICMTSLQDAMKSYDLGKKTYYAFGLPEYPLKVMPEMLSRLCAKCSEDKFGSLIELLLELYQSPKNSISNVQNLMQRVINNIPISSLQKYMDRFWEFPLFPDDARIQHDYPEPWGYIFERIQSVVRLTLGVDNIKIPMDLYKSAQLEKLFQAVRDPALKKSVIRKITYLSQIYDFEKDQRDKLDEILRNPDNCNSNGIPYLGDFYPSAISQFVNSNDVRIDCREQGLKNLVGEENASKWILMVRKESWRNVITQIQNRAEEDSYSSSERILQEGRSIIFRYRLSESEIQELASALLKLCQKTERYHENGYLTFRGKETQGDMKSAGVLMAEALLNTDLVSEDQAYQTEELLKLKAILDKNDIPTSLLSWCINKENKEETLIQNLFSGKDSMASEADNAICKLTGHGYSVGEELTELLIKSLLTANSYQVRPYALAIEYMAFKGILSEDQCNEVTRTLSKFISLTMLSGEETDKEAMDKLETRKRISTLAHTLYQRYVNAGREVPEQIMEWKELSNSPEEFAEIRNCWGEL